MSFLQHTEGPGSTAYKATAAILQYSAEIMKDNYKSSIDQTKLATKETKMIVEETIHAGKRELYAARKEGWTEIGAGVLTMGVGGLSMRQGYNSMGELNDATTTTNNMDDTIGQIETRDIGMKSGSIKTEEFDPANPTNASKELSNGDKYTKKNYEEYNQTTKALNTSPRTNDINQIQTREEANEVTTNLKSQKRDIEIRKNEIQRSIDMWRTAGQLVQPLNSAISASGKLNAAQDRYAKSQIEAAIQAARQSQEFANKTTDQDLQAANTAVQQMQAAEHMFTAIVAANTRA